MRNGTPYAQIKVLITTASGLSLKANCQTTDQSLQYGTEWYSASLECDGLVRCFNSIKRD